MRIAGVGRRTWPTVFALAFALFVTWASPPAQAVTISAPNLTVNVGDTFAVDISVNDAADLQFFQFDLGFEPSIVRANEAGANLGSALNADWFLTGNGAVDNTNGDIVGVSASNGFSTFSGTGVIAEFQFTALAIGASPLDFSAVALNLFEPFAVSNGLITVVAPAQAPEPATLGLLASGLLLVGARRLLGRQGQR